MKRSLRIATRKSPLAMWQAEHVKALLQAIDPERAVDIIGFSTEGDRRLSIALAEVGGKGLFIKELEQAMLDDAADLAVHSMKDVPGILPEGFELRVVGERADVRDALVGAESLLDLPANARIGSSSTRRAAQILHHNPEFDFVPVRGNVQTRLGKLDSGDVDALLLATAGLERLGLGARIGQRIATDFCLPAAGQGALGVEFLATRDDIAEVLAPLAAPHVAQTVQAERAVVTGINGDCTMPLGALCQYSDGRYHLEAALFSPSGDRVLRVAMSHEDPGWLGATVAERLVAMGALDLLAAAGIAS